MGWQWQEPDNMQVTDTTLQTDDHTNTSALNFYRPDAQPNQENSVKELKA